MGPGGLLRMHKCGSIGRPERSTARRGTLDGTAEICVAFRELLGRVLWPYLLVRSGRPL